MGSFDGIPTIRHAGCQFLVHGQAEGDVVFSDVPISFMMGVDAETGVVIDEHHPLLNTNLHGKVVAIPHGRGSCAASGVILELLIRDVAPAAFVFSSVEDILTFGVLLAQTMFNKSIPVVLVQDDQVWTTLSRGGVANIKYQELIIGDIRTPISPMNFDRVVLTLADQRMLRGEGCSRATQMAMKLIVAFAAVQEADSLIDVTQAHIDSCCYVGKSSLLVPERLHALGGKIVVPSTCNSLDVDKQRWKELGSDPEFSMLASKIGDLYLDMGAEMSFTCAPYLLDSKPKAGQQIGWGESNAVVFANSVLGTRTQKYPDYLDVMIALTGRAPYTGCHLEEGRSPRIRIIVPQLEGHDDSLWPLLGYIAGGIVGNHIPMFFGLENSAPDIVDLKAFGAGFATTSSAPMFHIRGVTPEASEYENHEVLKQVEISVRDLSVGWKRLNTATNSAVDLVSLGNPHFALEEFPRLIALIENRTKRENVPLIITTSRFIHQKAKDAGYLEKLEKFGCQFITDTCWCMIKEPVIPPNARNIMTNSAKYAHYGPGVSKRNYHFGSMAECVESACLGRRQEHEVRPQWLFAKKDTH